jgi:hypothetical protein
MQVRVLKCRNRVLAEHDLSVALSKTEPRIDMLVEHFSLTPLIRTVCKSEVYKHLSQIHLHSVFPNSSWHLLLVNIPCLRSVRITTLY